MTPGIIVGMTYHKASDVSIPVARRPVYIVSAAIRDSLGLRVWVNERKRGAGTVVMRHTAFMTEYVYTSDLNGIPTLLTQPTRHARLTTSKVGG